LLSIVVTREGRTTGIVVLKAPNDVLAKKAVEAVRDWRLKPATDREGNPVTARVNVEIYFRLLN
jgi:TonB family protein